jgi:2-polyprenyl-6-methoxyphenol hydroxylase-like FAD-dependent oxidoreductase
VSGAADLRTPLDVVVVGAGIGGLGSALALARAGHNVTVVERDDTPMPADVEAAFEWDRRGAPQVRHPHVFLGLARTILRDHFPDVLAALEAEGVRADEMRNDGPMQLDEATLAVLRADDDLRMLPCRRTTFEWVVRTRVLAEPRIDLRVGVGVAGLLVDHGDVGLPAVTGVALEDGSQLRADAVVATTGRRGDVPAWLEAHGIELPETSSDAGVVYFSRFYRTLDGAGFGFRGAFGAGLGVGVIGSDAGTFSITAVLDKEDKDLRTHLSDSARFDATMRLLPELADVTAIEAEPIHPVHCMTGLINRTRSFTTDDGTPRVVGLFAVGDAHTCTNPAYGRGQSLALLQATMLADALADAEDLIEAGRAYEAASLERVVPWYHFSVLTDSMRAATPAGRIGAPGSSGGPLAALFSGAIDDPEIIRTLMRVFNLLEPPTVLMEMLPRVQAAVAAAPSRPAAPRGPKIPRPTREDLLAVVA